MQSMIAGKSFLGAGNLTSSFHSVSYCNGREPKADQCTPATTSLQKNWQVSAASSGANEATVVAHNPHTASRLVTNDPPERRGFASVLWPGRCEAIPRENCDRLAVALLRV